MTYYNTNQNRRNTATNNQNPGWYDYYDYDYSYPARSGTSNKLYSQRQMLGQGSNQGASGYASRQYNGGYPNSGGGYQANSNGQYSNGYGQANYDYGYGSGLGAEAKQSYGSYSQSYGKECPGIPIALLLVSLLGVLVMGYILYTKIVGAGRRKRDISDTWSVLGTELENFEIVILHGRDSALHYSFYTLFFLCMKNSNLNVSGWRRPNPPIMKGKSFTQKFYKNP
jgi:hypothetical protein